MLRQRLIFLKGLKMIVTVGKLVMIVPAAEQKWSRDRYRDKSSHKRLSRISRVLVETVPRVMPLGAQDVPSLESLRLKQEKNIWFLILLMISNYLGFGRLMMSRNDTQVYKIRDIEKCSHFIPVLLQYNSPFISYTVLYQC